MFPENFFDMLQTTLYTAVRPRPSVTNLNLENVSVRVGGRPAFTESAFVRDGNRVIALIAGVFEDECYFILSHINFFIPTSEYGTMGIYREYSEDTLRDIYHDLSEHIYIYWLAAHYYGYLGV